MKTNRVLFMIVCICSLTIFINLAQGFTGIVGKVTDALTDQPIANVKINLAETTNFATSNQDGNYMLEIARPGVYTIEATADGYEGVCFDWQEVKTNEATLLVIQLAPKDLSSEQLSLVEGKLGMRQIETLPSEIPIQIILAVAEKFETIPALIKVLKKDGKVETMPFDKYLKGVVPAEIGAFGVPIDALKAQTITAKTYALYHMFYERKHAGQGVDVCLTTCCQAWSPARYPQTDEAIDNQDIKGLLLTYQGRLIDSLFFAHCDGRTLNSENVFPNILSYCRSVDCVCGIEFSLDKLWRAELDDCSGKTASQKIIDEFGKHYKKLPGLINEKLAKLEIVKKEFSKNGATSEWLITEYVWADGQWEKNRRFPSKVAVVNNQEAINVYKIYGHRVGMCQDGAKAMAKSGSTYSQILTHYYENVQLKWFPSEPVPPSTRFKADDKIVLPFGINLRASQTTKQDNILAKKKKGDKGMVTLSEANGIYNDGYYWWYIDFGNNEKGWCVEDYLDKDTSPPPPPPPSPPLGKPGKPIPVD